MCSQEEAEAEEGRTRRGGLPQCPATQLVRHHSTGKLSCCAAAVGSPVAVPFRGHSDTGYSWHHRLSQGELSQPKQPIPLRDPSPSCVLRCSRHSASWKGNFFQPLLSQWFSILPCRSSIRSVSMQHGMICPPPSLSPIAGGSCIG